MVGENRNEPSIMKKRKGFTVIELLVVVCVIGAALIATAVTIGVVGWLLFVVLL